MMKEGSEIQEEPEDEKPILYVGGAQPVFTSDIPENIQYVALGHLHRYQNIGVARCPVIYAGSPLSYSFAEANQQKYVAIIEAEPGEPVSVNKIPLVSGRRLLRKRFEEIDAAVKWLSENPNTFVELTIVSDTYLKTEDRKRLYNVHDGIVTIIPEVKNTVTSPLEQEPDIDLDKSMNDLFEDFFFHEKGQKPNEKIKELFKEIIGAP
ncbi:metallophosphoesterase family protein [Marinilabilia salmonicolor]|nr:hypothetical protein [Marinilabilia salmonicolor]